jgi:hypothetical protein
MRIALLVGMAVLGTVAKPAAAPVHRCTHVSGGFRACTTFFQQRDEQSAIYRRSGSAWAKVVGPLPRHHGWWRRVVSADDRRTLLAQWSGECEAQSTYFVSPAGGSIRPIFRGHASAIAGWTRPGLARVRLNEAIWAGNRVRRTPGVYLVDPETMAVTLQLERSPRPGC